MSDDLRARIKRVTEAMDDAGVPYVRDTVVIEAVIAAIDEHIPSLTVADEGVIADLAQQYVSWNEEVDIADLAKRTCKCGKKIDGFYEYVDHLKEVLR